jgi:hypothetical protein
MKILRLINEKMLTYKVNNSSSIIFKPMVHSKKIVKMQVPKKFGEILITTYPDGTQTSNSEKRDSIDFRKLEMLR